MSSTGVTERVSGRGVAQDGVSRELLQELDGPAWMYEWRLTPTLTTPLLGPNLLSVHRTREEMIEPVVRAALAAAGPGASALDLACNEGWFSHRLLAWGAHRVVGIDVRAQNIRRAELLREHFGISADRLTFLTTDVLQISPDELGRFDIVLVLGLIYHLERPLDALRIARRVTTRVCIIESQLTRQNRAILRGEGTPNSYAPTAASFAAWVEDQPENLLASTPGVMSLVPNRAALEAMPVWAGFEGVQSLSPLPHHDLQYIVGDRAIVAATVAGEPGGPVTGLPLPPLALQQRVGRPDGKLDPALEYERMGSAWKTRILEHLPDEWAWPGRRALDFGAGAGRLLRHFHAEASQAEFWACDIDEPSVTWMRTNLAPPFHPFLVDERPGLPQVDGFFDLIWAASVFTHLTDHWAGWLLELHRVLGDHGLLLTSFLGPRMAAANLPLPWEEARTGMLVVNKGTPWELGGPLVFHSHWWLRAHWGRAFEVVAIDPDEGNHGLVTLRKRLVSLNPADLERPEPDEPREWDALRHNVDQLHAIDRTRWQ